MHGMLGKIVSVTKKEEAEGNCFEVAFRAACLLPVRNATPEWLKDQTLKIEREVVDPREIGGPGDSIVLSPSEADRWLRPLTISPDVAYGEMPDTLRISLRWWKGDSAPDFTVRANGRRIIGKFTKEGEEYRAELQTRDFFQSLPLLPVMFEVTCDKLKASCTILPEDAPFCAEVHTPEGELHRVENSWFVMDVTAKMHAGAILALVEKGRRVDHFQRPENMIQHTLKNGGHTDRLRKGWGWYDQLNEVAMTCHGARREGRATHLHLDGVADEGTGVRTSVSYCAYDDLPLITMRRDYHLHIGKKEEGKDKEKQNAPKEPIDDSHSFAPMFRAAWRTDDPQRNNSRVLYMDRDSLTAVRCVQIHDVTSGGSWGMSQGWAVVEHPFRREYTMYLFDEQALPCLFAYLGPGGLSLEPHWKQTVTRAGDSIGYTLGLTAGELCGASTYGAWVACRVPLPSGGLRCGIITRLHEAQDNPAAVFNVGGAAITAPLQSVLTPGLGVIRYAAVDFAEGGMDEAFDVVAAGIETRRES